MALLLDSLNEIRDAPPESVGGKAKALAALAAQGVDVPRTLCVPTSWYHRYVTETKLGQRIQFELGRKSFDEMRWEEVWDTALRIRNLFLNTPLPPSLEHSLRCAVTRTFGKAPVVVRSSAPGEDSADSSFAGLHESFVNVRGSDDILKHIRLVWASLWSDGALLYRRELGLAVGESSMAVRVQRLV